MYLVHHIHLASQQSVLEVVFQRDAEALALCRECYSLLTVHYTWSETPLGTNFRDGVSPKTERDTERKWEPLKGLVETFR